MPQDKRIPAKLITIGDHIRKHRIELGLLQKDLAKLIGVSEDSITFWEKGRHSPQQKFLGRFFFLIYKPKDLFW